MMTTIAFCILIVVAAAVMLVALYRRDHVTARLKLPGCDFSLEARDRKTDRR
jgi:hypothetical protein